MQARADFKKVDHNVGIHIDFISTSSLRFCPDWPLFLYLNSSVSHYLNCLIILWDKINFLTLPSLVFISADMLRGMVNRAVSLSDSKQDLFLTVSPNSWSLHKICFDNQFTFTGKTTDPEWGLVVTVSLRNPRGLITVPPPTSIRLCQQYSLWGHGTNQMKELMRIKNIPCRNPDD